MRENYTRVVRPAGLRPWHGPHLAHGPEQVVLGPLLDQLAALVETVYLDATHLDIVARGSDAEEFALVGAAGRIAGYHLVALCYLIHYDVGEIGNSVTEPCDLLLHRVRSPNLSGLGVRVVADEIGIEDLVDYLQSALTEAVLHQAASLFLVLFRHLTSPFRRGEAIIPVSGLPTSLPYTSGRERHIPKRASLVLCVI